MMVELKFEVLRKVKELEIVQFSYYARDDGCWCWAREWLGEGIWLEMVQFRQRLV